MQTQCASSRGDAADALNSAVALGKLEAVKRALARGCVIEQVEAASVDLAMERGHWRVVDYLTDAGFDAIISERQSLAAMTAEMFAAAPVYQPSAYWKHFNELHLRQLSLGGMARFKLSINQYYFNFVPHSPLDPKLLRLIGHWLRNPSLTPWRAKLVDPDIDKQTGARLPVNRSVFTIMSRRGAIGSIARKVQMLLYRVMVCMLWDFTRAHDRLGLLGKLEEPRLGAPIEIIDANRLISQDLAHSVLECNAILELSPIGSATGEVRVAEIGAGYGRLGHVLLAALPCKYFVFDIPPGLCVSQWYLSNLFPNKRIFRFRRLDSITDVFDELLLADIAFFTPNQIELFPAGFFDLSVNISSLHEMRAEQIDHFLRQMHRVTKRRVFLKQYKRAVNPYDKIVITEDCYRRAPGWRHVYHRTNPVDPRFFEMLSEAPAPPTAPSSANTNTRAAPSSRLCTTPTVSVLMPNYNHAAFLRKALAGACEQTHPADEILVLDDGSTDDSLSIIESFQSRHPQVRVLRNASNRGLPYSINRLLAEAKSEFVVSAAADDELLPEFLEKSLATLSRHAGATICFSELVVRQANGEVINYSRTRPTSFGFADFPEYVWPKLLRARLRDRYLVLSSNTAVVNRTALLELGSFIPQLEWHSDWFAFYSVALRFGACLVPEPLAIIRANPGGYSDSGMRDKVRQRRVLYAMIEILRDDPYADLLAVFRSHPSLLSVFDYEVLPALATTPKNWDLLVPYFLWGINYYRRNRALSWPQLCAHLLAESARKIHARISPRVS